MWLLVWRLCVLFLASLWLLTSEFWAPQFIKQTQKRPTKSNLENTKGFNFHHIWERLSKIPPIRDLPVYIAWTLATTKVVHVGVLRANNILYHIRTFSVSRISDKDRYMSIPHVVAEWVERPASRAGRLGDPKLAGSDPELAGWTLCVSNQWI